MSTRRSYIIASLALIILAPNFPLLSQTLVLPAFPDSFSFCGERVRDDIPDVRDRLEEIFYSRIGSDERIFLLLRRGRRYFPMFEKLLKEAGAPDDLKYLSVAESALRIDAYSGADAAGLWQFLPSTAKLWGLRVDKWVDERYHVEKSTRAAIRVLQQLHDQFGSWSVAAAAYNTGEPNIYRAQKDQHQGDYYDLFLNRETRGYVLQIAVLKEVFEHPERYGYAMKDRSGLKPFDESTKSVTLQGPVSDIGALAKRNGTNYKNLKLLNYWIMRNELPGGSWNLIVPSELTFDSLNVAKPVGLDSAKLIPAGSISFIHMVESGESLTLIAAQYGVTIGQLLDWNPLPTDNINVGQSLKVFVPSAGRVRHMVRQGDNLIRIADYYRVTVARIKEWNQLSSDMLKAGDTLTIYVGQN